MPCNSYDSHPMMTTAIKQRLDITTKLACLYCKGAKKVPKWAEAWWKHHQNIDAKRIKEEAFQKAKQELDEKHALTIAELRKKLK